MTPIATTENSSTLRQPVPRAKLLWATPASTTAERSERIEVLGKRIAGYIAFLCDGCNPCGASAEARETAVKAFYEQMIVLERQLGRIHDEFQLK